MGVVTHTCMLDGEFVHVDEPTFDILLQLDLDVESSGFKMRNDSGRNFGDDMVAARMGETSVLERLVTAPNLKGRLARLQVGTDRTHECGDCRSLILLQHAREGDPTALVRATTAIVTGAA